MIKEKNMVTIARQFAIENHGDQMYGNKPYSFHLDDVHAIVVQFNLGIEYEIAAYLHDILEDTNVSKLKLIETFGEDIAEMVFCVSGFGANRKEKQLNIKQKMPNYPRSINLKMADRLANMIHSKHDKPKLYDLYCREHVELASIFAMGDTKLFEAIETAAGIIKPKMRVTI